jgi:glycosyltransferase involved in cell wall biosynthesis
MRICTYYDSRPSGRNDGAPVYWTLALRGLGHEVVHLTSEDTGDLPRFGKFDLHLWIDWGEDALMHLLPYKPMDMSAFHPSAYVTSDTHLGFDYRLNKAREFDFVFCNQIRAVEDFAKAGVKARWLPHAVEPKAYPNTPAAIPKYDVGFVGFVSFLKRAEMLDRVFREFPNFWYGQRLFEEAAEIYRKSRVVFNTAAVDDINMRCFEATATGAFCLAEWVPTLKECFSDGVHLATYRTIDEAVDKIGYYLSHPNDRARIAREGMLYTLGNHTYQHRIKELMEVVNHA